MYTTYKLSSDENGIDCTENGLTCGGLPLVAKSVATGRFEPCNPHLLQKSGITISAGGLQNVARALNENNLTTAMIAALHLMPSLGFMVKAGYRDDEARDEQGRWTAGDGDDDSGDDNSSNSSSAENSSSHPLAAANVKETPAQRQAKKERFVDAHIADAQKIANQLGTSIENILGLSAYESGWGEGPFATNHNYFSMHASPSNPNGIPAKDSNVKMQPYQNYAESAQDFANQFGGLVQGEKDPIEFARKLQDAGKYGIDVKTGKKTRDFVSGASQTMIGLRPLIANKNL